MIEEKHTRQVCNQNESGYNGKNSDIHSMKSNPQNGFESSGACRGYTTTKPTLRLTFTGRR